MRPSLQLVSNETRQQLIEQLLRLLLLLNHRLRLLLNNSLQILRVLLHSVEKVVEEVSTADALGDLPQPRLDGHKVGSAGRLLCPALVHQRQQLFRALIGSDLGSEGRLHSAHANAVQNLIRLVDNFLPAKSFQRLKGRTSGDDLLKDDGKGVDVALL